jgi:hypothetical protein
MTISRFDRTVPGLVQKALSGRPHTTAGDKRSSPSLSGQVLARASGKTQQEIAAACKGACPNHVGAAISRHKRAGRIEERDGKLYATQSTGTEQRPRSDTGMN